MRCRECELLLWSYVDGELPAADRQAVSAHLAGCQQCSLALQRLRTFPLQPGQLPFVAPPPDFTMRLMQRITVLPSPHELAAQQVALQSMVNTPARMMIAFSAAAAAVLVGIISTAAMAMVSGRAVINGGTMLARQNVANSLGNWFVTEYHLLFSWPVLVALVGMQFVLVVLWIGVVAPRQQH
ncbi:MAG: anti-sigma factor family protein [Thermomicrobiales bacterium]|jgi:anti-sigma factor RsiW|nr:zf-HC2 domain-containing protein [Thermomicrobiales bacterium]